MGESMGARRGEDAATGRDALAASREPLRELHDALTGRGFEVDLGATRTGVPVAVVTNPCRPGLLCENVYCGHDLHGTLRFVWPWGSWLAPVTDVPAAVAEILRVLGGDDG